MNTATAAPWTTQDEDGMARAVVNARAAAVNEPAVTDERWFGAEPAGRQHLMTEVARPGLIYLAEHGRLVTPAVADLLTAVKAWMDAGGPGQSRDLFAPTEHELAVENAALAVWPEHVTYPVGSTVGYWQPAKPDDENPGALQPGEADQPVPQNVAAQPASATQPDEPADPASGSPTILRSASGRGVRQMMALIDRAWIAAGPGGSRGQFVEAMTEYGALVELDTRLHIVSDLRDPNGRFGQYQEPSAQEPRRSIVLWSELQMVADYLAQANLTGDPLDDAYQRGYRKAKDDGVDALVKHADLWAPLGGNPAQLRMRRHLMIGVQLVSLIGLTREELIRQTAAALTDALRQSYDRAEGELPPHLRDDAPYQVCDACGRKTWSSRQFGQTCQLPQPPDGHPCDGTFHG